MYRSISSQLLEWKNSVRRKPLILQGARQVGKTYIVKQFAIEHYRSLLYINFELETSLHSIFEHNLDPNYIIERLGLVKQSVIEPKSTLIFFDEIQACSKAITSLKYFFENAPEYQIIAAGSLLGVSFGHVDSNSSFPVGKVTFMNLYPMSFYEYLKAFDYDQLADFLKNHPEEIDEPLHSKLIDQLKMFLLIGGMPEAVASYVEYRDIAQVKQIHQDINLSYENDFTKYTDVNQSIRTREVWKSIPYQLGRENKKFKYNDIKPNARASQYEATIEWLVSAGLIYKVNQLRTALMPLQAYEDTSKYKIYPLDTGLLGTSLNINNALILEDTGLFSAFKGALTESFICSEIIKYFNTNPHYWMSNSQAEVDFVFALENQIIPLEVKSGMDRQTKSLRSFKKSEEAPLVFRASPRKFSKAQDGFVNLGLYSVMGLQRLIKNNMQMR